MSDCPTFCSNDQSLKCVMQSAPLEPGNPCCITNVNDQRCPRLSDRDQFEADAVSHGSYRSSIAYPESMSSGSPTNFRKSPSPSSNATTSQNQRYPGGSPENFTSRSGQNQTSRSSPTSSPKPRSKFSANTRQQADVPVRGVDAKVSTSSLQHGQKFIANLGYTAAGKNKRSSPGKSRGSSPVKSAELANRYSMKSTSKVFRRQGSSRKASSGKSSPQAGGKRDVGSRRAKFKTTAISPKLSSLHQNYCGQTELDRPEGSLSSYTIQNRRSHTLGRISLPESDETATSHHDRDVTCEDLKSFLANPEVQKFLVSACRLMKNGRDASMGNLQKSCCANEVQDTQELLSAAQRLIQNANSRLNACAEGNDNVDTQSCRSSQTETEQMSHQNSTVSRAPSRGSNRTIGVGTDRSSIYLIPHSNRPSVQRVRQNSRQYHHPTRIPIVSKKRTRSRSIQVLNQDPQSTFSGDPSLDNCINQLQNLLQACHNQRSSKPQNDQILATNLVNNNLARGSNLTVENSIHPSRTTSGQYYRLSELNSNAGAITYPHPTPNMLPNASWMRNSNLTAFPNPYDQHIPGRLSQTDPSVKIVPQGYNQQIDPKDSRDSRELQFMRQRGSTQRETNSAPIVDPTQMLNPNLSQGPETQEKNIGIGEPDLLGRSPTTQQQNLAQGLGVMEIPPYAFAEGKEQRLQLKFLEEQIIEIPYQEGRQFMQTPFYDHQYFNPYEMQLDPQSTFEAQQLRDKARPDQNNTVPRTYEQIQYLPLPTISAYGPLRLPGDHLQKPEWQEENHLVPRQSANPSRQGIPQVNANGNGPSAQEGICTLGSQRPRVARSKAPCCNPSCKVPVSAPEDCPCNATDGGVKKGGGAKAFPLNHQPIFPNILKSMKPSKRQNLMCCQRKDSISGLGFGCRGGGFGQTPSPMPLPTMNKRAMLLPILSGEKSGSAPQLKIQEAQLDDVHVESVTFENDQLINTYCSELGGKVVRCVQLDYTAYIQEDDEDEDESSQDEKTKCYPTAKKISRKGDCPCKEKFQACLRS